MATIIPNKKEWMNCNICGKESQKIFSKKVLFKYDVDYFKCNSCLFIQTEKPYWLQEAYRDAITSLDLGLVSRNQYLAVVVKAMVNSFFNKDSKFLDYGGGYGLLVRMLRDSGFDYYREDKYCDNLFAKNFDISDLTNKIGFELVTAFELFEHLQDPLTEIEKILSKGKNILFSTDLQPYDQNVESWEYIAPEIGQHISFYHYETLLFIGETFKMNVYSNKKNIHLLTRKKLNNHLFTILTKRKIAVLYNIFTHRNHTLLTYDYEMVKNKLIHSHRSIKNIQ